MRQILLIVLGLVLSGCVIKPKESAAEVDRLESVGREYGYTTDATRSAPRPAVPDLPESPTWREVLRRAFLANGDLEAAFHEWAMAVQRIDAQGAWPSQPLELGFEYMFSAERMKTFDRMTFSAGLMDSTGLPNKAYTSAEVAWRDAQAAGERFRAAKFDLQMRVLQAWADYALQGERVRIQERNLGLLQLVAETAASRVRAGGAQQEQLRADVELRMAENELATARALLQQQRAALNSLLRREPNAPLTPPAGPPEARPLPASDDELMAAGVGNSPELAALGFDVESRRAGIRRAQLEYFPEFNPMAAFTGSLSQSVGAAVVLPTQLPRIRAMVAESRADLRRVQAMAGQAQADRAGRFAVTLIALRDAERRAMVFERDVLPLSEQTVESTRRSYQAGAATYLDLIDTQRTLLDVRLMAAEARTMREKMLAELEALAGMDVETIPPATTQATQE